MSTWQSLLLAIALTVALYAVLVASLVVTGRRRDAAALARFIPDCIVLFRRLISDGGGPTIPTTRPLRRTGMRRTPPSCIRARGLSSVSFSVAVIVGVGAVGHWEVGRVLALGKHAHHEVSIGQHAHQTVPPAADGQHTDA